MRFPPPRFDGHPSGVSDRIDSSTWESTREFGWGRDFWLAALLLVGITTYQWRHRWQDFAFTSDAGAYLAGARSLAAGQGYLFSAHAGQPPISLYPPLQSGLLAPAFRWGPPFPENVPHLHAIMIGLGLLTLGVVYVFLRVEGVPRMPTAWFVLLWGISAQWITWLGYLVSDVGFAMIPAALALIWRWDQSGPEWRRWLWMGLGMAVAYWLRTAIQAGTLALGIIVIGRCLIGGDWRRAACYLVPVGVSYVGWQRIRAGGIGYQEMLTAWFEYEGGLRGYVRTLAAHIWILIRGYEFWPFLAAPLRRQQLLWQQAGQWWLAIPLLAAMVIGHVWWLGRTALGILMDVSERDIVVLFALAIYCLQLFFVPFHGYDYQRYLYPFAPFLFNWFLRSGTAKPDHAARSLRRTCWVLAGFCLLNLLGRRIVDDINRTRFSLDEIREMAVWFRDQTPTGTRIAMDWNLPVEHWYAWNGRPVVVDERVRSASVSPVRRSQQGVPEPEYFLWSPYANAADPAPPPGELVRSSPSRGLQLFRYTGSGR